MRYKLPKGQERKVRELIALVEQARKVHGLSTRKMCEKAGYREGLWRAARDGKALPHPETVERLARAVGVPYDPLPRPQKQDLLPSTPTRRLRMAHVAAALERATEQAGLDRKTVSSRAGFGPYGAYRYYDGADMRVSTLLELCAAIRIMPTDLFGLYEECRHGLGEQE